MRRLNSKPILFLVFFFLSALAWITPALAQSWSNGYAHRRAITIDHTRVPNTDQSNFPFLFSGNYSYLATTSNGGNVTNSSGYDIIFTSDAAGAVTLPFEQEGYNASTGAVSYWIQNPTLSHTTDTVIYMFYGNSGINSDQSNKTAVWDSNYKGVWHLPNGTTLTASDSTSNGNNGSLVGSPTAVAGQIGGAAGLNGSSQYIRVANASSLKPTSALTLSGWVYLTGATNWSHLFSLDYRSDGTWNTPYSAYSMCFNSNTNEPYANIAINGTMQSAGSSSALSLNTWHYMVTTYDGSTIRLFVDGSNVASTSASGSISYNTSQDLALGQRSPYSSSEYVTGNLDELRVSAVPRSADWIAAEYNNQSSPSAFYTMGFADSSNGYSYVSPITISHTKVPNTDQTNFPALISGTYSYLATTANGGYVTNSNGYDIVFTSDAGGMNPLAYERESYNSATGATNFWVKVPILSHTTDTVIYMFYGNSSVTSDQSNPSGTWPSNFLGVWHLPNGSSLTANDSTSNGNSGTVQGGVTATAGGIDGAGGFDGSSGYISTTNSFSWPLSVTSEAWINTTSSAGHKVSGFEGSQTGTTSSGYDLNLYVNTNGKVVTTCFNSGFTTVTSSTVVNDGNWHHLVAMLDNSTHIMTLYVDGASQGTANCSGTGSFTGYFRIGSYKLSGWPNGGDGYFNGKIDEVRLSNTPRSSDWIATEYSNQSSPSTFSTVAASTAVPNLTSLSPTSGPAGTSVTIAGTNFGSTQGSSTVAFSGVTTTPTSWSNTQIVVPVPSGTTPGNVVVTVSNSNSNGLSFTDTSAGIVGVSPGSGEIGIPVTITGVSFGSSQGSSTVTFNGTVGSPTSWGNTQIVVPVPSGAANGSIVVTVSATASNGVYFAVTVPSITALSQSLGTTGTAVTISGSNFGATQGSSTVTFNGTAGTPTSWSSTSIVVPVPTAASDGNVVVTVGTSSSNGASFSVLPNITSISPPSGLVGTTITITGTGFGTTQGTSTLTFNGTAATPTSWSNTSVVVAVPSGATSGNVLVTVAGLISIGQMFDVLPTGWLDQDVGSVGIAGSATYLNETFTVNGSGGDIYGNADGMHFVYQSLSGDGTIIARLVNFQCSSTFPKAGVMIRETLSPSATNAYTFLQQTAGTNYYFSYRPTTGGSTPQSSGSGGLPYWMKVIRSGNTFSGYISPDAVNWTQIGSTQTISMATNVYVGLAVTSANSSTLATATFDSVSINSSATVAPVITSLSATTGSVGSHVVITGTGFGNSQNGSIVMLNGTLATINSWGSSSIAFTVPSGATTGYLTVSVAPSMNISNLVVFEVTNNPLPLSWLDQDLGAVGTAGSATYSSGTFTVNGGGNQLGGTGDQIHYVYQPLSGDGTIVARLDNLQNGPLYEQAGVMIRETLTSGATMAFMGYQPATNAPTFIYRTTTNGSATKATGNTVTLPYWFMLIRSGNTFMAYTGPDGVNWTQVGATQTISMATNVYVGLAVNADSTTTLATATLDNVAISNTATFITPVLNSLTPPAAPKGGAVTLSGTDFGSSQSSSAVSFNGVAPNISSWSSTSITAAVPNSASSGPVTVTVAGVTSNAVQFSVIEASTVTGLSPSTGPVGSSVAITGTGFGSTQSNSTVNFYGATATSITSWSDTQIVAVVPAYVGTGIVSVTVAGITTLGPTFTLSRSSQLTDSLGNVSNYAAIDVGGEWKPISEAGSGCSSCTDRGTIISTYDSKGNVLTRTDPAGHTTTFTYDTSNDVLSESVQLNGTTTATTSYTYNGFGEVLTVTDPLGNVTTNAYDSNGNLTSISSPKPDGNTAASVTTFAYNTLGELTKITDPIGHVTSMTYTAAGLIATITDAQNNVTTYGYDAKGNRTSVTDALSHQTTFAYDAMSRLTTITYPDTTTSTFAYDSRGRRISVTDQNGKTTTYAYDDADRLTGVTDAANHVTYYAYDTESNLTSITDANSNQTAFTYDAYGRVTKTNFPSSLSEMYQYDADNNLTQKTDRKGQTITYLYDALNRLTSKTYPDTTAVDYVYDLVGKITQVNDPTGTYAFAYDNMGRLIGTTTSYSFLTSRNFTNAYTYDSASNRAGFTDPESGSTAYTYDTLNRLTSLAPPSAFGSGSFGFSYDALSRRTQMTRPNSVTTNYAYDNLSRLTSVLHQLSGSTIDGASYTLDSGGNRTAKTDQLAAVTSNYTYDAIYQLTQVTKANNTTESYSYDPVGNRTASLGVSSYTTNASNELTATSNASFTYDSNGNTLMKTLGSNTTSYTWDYENRLTSVTLPGSGGTVTFKYDPLGRRIEKASPTFTTIFAYDGDNLIETTNSAGGVVARYTQTQSIDEPLAELRSSTTSYYEADGLGSVTSLTSSAGAVANTYTYDSYGDLTASAGSISNPFSYTGRELDSETGLYYYRARYYDPIVGRFIGEDPMRPSDGTSFYDYVAGNPTNYYDPLGLFLWPWETPVTVVGGTAQQQQQVKQAVDKILKTPRGQALEKQIRGPWYWHGDPKTIHINCNKDEDANTPGPDINIDPTYHPEIQTSQGRQLASTQRIIAHELGHAVTGIHDDGPGRMNNVNQNENPIATQLGEPYRRTQY